MPSGGPKDTTSPKVVGEKPENGTTNFTGKTIKITFDEFVTLNNASENVIISPPVSEHVEFTTQGKSVILKFRNNLSDNTTYNLFFSDCIQDFHESNKLSGYTFAFSTGDSIDQYKLFGKVENAETNQPEAGVFVMLYENDIDSLPLSTQPNYLTKTDDNGYFSFFHLKSKKYKVFALKDINADLMYNLPNEFIAFSDTVHQAHFYENDSLFEADTRSLITLRLFQEEDTVQLIAPHINPQKGVYHFPYKIPINSFNIKIEGDTAVDFFSKINDTKDTLTIFFKTLFIDSAIVYIQTDDKRIDTVEIRPYRNTERYGKTRVVPKSKIDVTLSNKDNLFLITTLNFSYPIKPVDSVAISIISSLFKGRDTTVIYISIPDSFVMQVPIPYVFEPKINYSLWLRDSLFYGYNNDTNDTVMFSFSKKTEKDYGNLILHYIVEEKQNIVGYIVQLLTSSQKLIRKDFITSSQKIEYKHLIPGGYRIKVIEKKNRNEKWDTGNYQKKLQPEKIFFIEKEINIRGFWDVEEDIELDTG